MTYTRHDVQRVAADVVERVLAGDIEGVVADSIRSDPSVEELKNVLKTFTLANERPCEADWDTFIDPIQMDSGNWAVWAHLPEFDGTRSDLTLCLVVVDQANEVGYVLEDLRML